MPSDTILTDVESFLKRTGLSATRFGVLAAGDTKFVKTLREGRKPREKTAAAVRAFMRKYRGK